MINLEHISKELERYKEAKEPQFLKIFKKDIRRKYKLKINPKKMCPRDEVYYGHFLAEVGKLIKMTQKSE